MSGQLPPPLPIVTRCRSGSRFPSFLAGLVVGTVIVGLAATTFIRREQSRTQEALARMAGLHGVSDQVLNLVGDNLKPFGDHALATPVATNDAEKVKALGDETVEDLRQGRQLAAYKLTTADYKNRVKREEFDKMLAEVPNLRMIYPNPQMRESKVRKATDGDGYEFYCSSGSNNFGGNVVFSFVFEPGDNGAWRISQFEVNQANR